MAMNPLPPQAYTKDTLLKAYSWLQNQNASIKEIAATPDILVSLYLKATRDGEAVLERPSIQNFKNELKSLAGLMGELEKPPMEVNELSSPEPTKLAPLGLSKDLPLDKLGEAIKTQVTLPIGNTHIPKNLSHSNLLHLDEKSHFLILEAKNKLNLSCEQETLRMMIKIAFDRLQNL